MGPYSASNKEICIQKTLEMNSSPQPKIISQEEADQLRRSNKKHKRGDDGVILNQNNEDILSITNTDEMDVSYVADTLRTDKNPISYRNIARGTNYEEPLLGLKYPEGDEDGESDDDETIEGDVEGELCPVIRLSKEEKARLR